MTIQKKVIELLKDVAPLLAVAAFIAIVACVDKQLREPPTITKGGLVVDDRELPRLNR